MIEFRDFSFTYPEAVRPVLREVSLSVPEGEMCAVIGHTGSGKSTLLRAINGLVPHFSGGRVTGDVRVQARSTRDHPPREMADLVGYVGQVPADGFVADTVEEELAYTMENLGVPPRAMRRRMEDVLDLLKLHQVRRRRVRSLSGGQQQRVAIGAVLTASPAVLVLDEPTSALDPAAAEDVLSALARLVGDVGLTVVLAEHRLERVLPFVDSIITVDETAATARLADPAAAMAHAPVAPPIVRLGRVAGWDPLPLSVRDARRHNADLKERLRGLTPTGPPHTPLPATEPTPVEVSGLVAAYGSRKVINGLDLEARAGEVVAVMGRNGSGKSTLFAHIAGAATPSPGRVLVAGHPPRDWQGTQRIRHVGLLPQDPGLLLWASTVREECESADKDGGLPPGTTASTLETLGEMLPPERHPRDLSEGQRLSLALAMVLAPGPEVVLLDEPTRGLDYGSKARLVAMLRSLASTGSTVLVATHDVELAAQVATRVVLLADGDVVGDGPAADMVLTSPVFAPQVAKILNPSPWLTVEQVETALGGNEPVQALGSRSEP